MERFQRFETKNKVILVYLQSKLQQDRYKLMYLLVKIPEIEIEKTHLEANKQQTMYGLTYLDVWKMEKWDG